MTMPTQPSKPQADTAAPDPATGSRPGPGSPRPHNRAPGRPRGGLGTVARQFAGPSRPVGKRRVPGHARETVTDQRSTRSPDEGFGRRGRGFRICRLLPGGKVAQGGRSRSYFPVWCAMPWEQSAMIMTVSIPALTSRRGREGHACGPGTLMD